MDPQVRCLLTNIFLDGWDLATPSSVSCWWKLCGQMPFFFSEYCKYRCTHWCKNWRTLVTTDNVKPDSQLRFHGQAQHSLQSSRTTSEFAIKWSQAEHCTLPPVPRLWCSQCFCYQSILFCSWLMRSRAVGFIYSSAMVTVTSPWW